MDQRNLLVQLQLMCQNPSSGFVNVEQTPSELILFTAGGESYTIRKEVASFHISNGDYDIYIKGPCPKRIQAIKEIRSFTNMGLKEAKDLADLAELTWQLLGRGVAGIRCNEIKGRLEATGMNVMLEDRVPVTPEDIKKAKDALVAVERELDPPKSLHPNCADADCLHWMMEDAHEFS